MELPGLVEPPVLGDSQAGVAGSLLSTSCLPVLRDAISMTKSGGLPCTEMMYPLLSLYASGSALNAISRSGAIRSAAGAPGSWVRYLSPATMVVFGVAEVLNQVVDAAAQGEMVEARHVFWLALGRVGELYRALRLGALSGHVRPLGSGCSGRWVYLVLSCSALCMSVCWIRSRLTVSV